MTAKKSLKKILIVEDEVPMARALSLKLEREGFEAVRATNGEEALDEIKKTKFDLALIDLVMPKMDGFSLLEHIRKQKNKMPVIVLSNLSQEEDEKKAKELGAKGFFVKSNTTIAEIIKEVQKIFA